MDESTCKSKGRARPVVAYRPGRDDRRGVALKDGVIASFYICMVALLLFFLVVVLVGEWLVGAQGPSVLDLVLIGGSCVLFALVAVVAVRRRLSGRPVQPLAGSPRETDYRNLVRRLGGMAGRMFGILAAVLLLLFAGAVVVWVRSYRTTDVVAHSGDYLWQVAVARGQVWVQRVGYFERVKDWHVVSESGPPEGALTEYVETRASYVEGVARLERVFRTWRWASDRSGGWRWTSEPPGVPVLVASPGVGESVPGWWPGARPVALRASARWIERTRLGPGVTVRGTEQWFIGRTITVPLWMIAAALALPAGWVCAAWVKRWRVRRWVDENRCAACGYDLRATPGRCPECGTLTGEVSSVRSVRHGG